MSKMNFNELDLSEAVLKAVKEMGFEEASPIQAEAIPAMLTGKDIIAQAQTGSGKTAAFAIPLLEMIDFSKQEIQALVLCPTRELVIQATEEFKKIGKYQAGLMVVPVYGGADIGRQLMALKRNPQIIIGTPGRLLDHLRRKSVRMETVSKIVFDEADEMLDMGFKDDIESILKDTPENRQTVMFSATMAPNILKLMKNHQKDPMHIDVTHHKLNAPKIEQFYFEVREKDKPEILARLIDAHAVKSALVFCNTKMKVDNLVENLKGRGYSSDALHGDLSQKQRDKVMGGFRKGTVDILIATDVAGRGIDVQNVDAVFNYDLPRDDEDFVHRIGRTGRAGKSGRAFTFIVGREAYSLKRIEHNNTMIITKGVIPSLADLDDMMAESEINRIKSELEVEADKKFVNKVEQLMGDDYTSMDIAAGLLKIMLAGKKKGFGENIDLSVVRYEQETGGGRRPGRSSRFGGDRSRDNFKRGGERSGGFSDRGSRFGGDRSSKFATSTKFSAGDKKPKPYGEYAKRPRFDEKKVVGAPKLDYAKNDLVEFDLASPKLTSEGGRYNQTGSSHSYKSKTGDSAKFNKFKGAKTGGSRTFKSEGSYGKSKPAFKSEGGDFKKSKPSFKKSSFDKKIGDKRGKFKK